MLTLDWSAARILMFWSKVKTTSLVLIATPVAPVAGSVDTSTGASDLMASSVPEPLQQLIIGKAIAR